MGNEVCDTCQCPNKISYSIRPSSDVTTRPSSDELRFAYWSTSWSLCRPTLPFSPLAPAAIVGPSASERATPAMRTSFDITPTEFASRYIRVVHNDGRNVVHNDEAQTTTTDCKTGATMIEQAHGFLYALWQADAKLCFNHNSIKGMAMELVIVTTIRSGLWSAKTSNATRQPAAS